MPILHELLGLFEAVPQAHLDSFVVFPCQGPKTRANHHETTQDDEDHDGGDEDGAEDQDNVNVNAHEQDDLEEQSREVFQALNQASENKKKNDAEKTGIRTRVSKDIWSKLSRSDQTAWLIVAVVYWCFALPCFSINSAACVRTIS